MTRGTILVLGTNAGQADLIRHMKGRGWRVIGVSPAIGEAGQPFCDLVERVDISDVDAVVSLAERHKPDCIYSISSDTAIRTVVAASTRLGLPHFHNNDFIALLDDKAALRGFLDRHHLSPVPFRKVSDPAMLDDWSVYPCMVKPTDAQGQRGVQRIDRPESLAKAVRDAAAASRSGQAIVEAFLDGIEVSCNVLISGGITKLKVLSQRLLYGAAAPGVPLGHLIPARDVSPALRAETLDLIDRVIAAMGQPDGPLYFQMIMTKSGPRIVEIAPRLDGCHMWRLIHAAYGVDLIEMTVDALLAKPTEKHDTPDAELAVWELMFQHAPPHSVFDPAEFPKATGVVHHEYRYAAGETVRPVNGVVEVVGYHVRRAP